MSTFYNVGIKPILCQSLAALLLAGCQAPIATRPVQNPATSQAQDIKRHVFQLQSVHADEPASSTLSLVTETPDSPDFELRFYTNISASNSIRIPAEGVFKLRIKAGESYALLDSDARDGQASIQVPAGIFNLYLHPESPRSPLCQSENSTGSSLTDQVDQVVLAKIDSLIAQGKSACTYLPPANQRQNANCNSSANGLQCSGPINKTLSAANCPEMAIYAGALNLNHALPNTKLFVSTSNNITLNQTANGILATHGNLNTSLNSGQLEGIFAGSSSSNLNLNAAARIKGLMSLNGSLSANLNNGAIFEGVLCSSGNLNFNRNGSSQTLYHPDILKQWLVDVPQLPEFLCAPRSNLYTQTIPLDCSSSATSRLQITDALYELSQSLNPQNTDSWYEIPRRPLPVPEDWRNPEGADYVIEFENHGTPAITLKGHRQTQSAQVPASVKVIPAVDCIRSNPQGGYTAFLSYTNLMGAPVSFPAGDANRLIAVNADGTTPDTFATGQSPVFPNSPVSVNFAGSELSWQLGARMVTARSDDPGLKCPERVQSPELLIEDVRFSETNVSVMGSEAPGKLQPDFTGQDIALTLTGVFKDEEHQPLPLTEFLFVLAPPLVQQTFIGSDPQARVLLDDSILLETTSVTETEIHTVLHTEKVPDLYLKGLHRLSVELGDWYTDTLIQIGEPTPPPGSLQPSIDSVEVMRDEQSTPLHLRLTGHNFMLYPKFSYATVDGSFGFGFSTEADLDGTMRTIVHIPHPETFDQISEHLIILATPFGVTVKAF